MQGSDNIKKEQKITLIKTHSSLFATGFVQVYFVCVNTYFIATTNFSGVLFASFVVSFVWSFNVKRVAFGSVVDRLAYALGATAGSGAGLASSLFFAQLLQ